MTHWARPRGLKPDLRLLTAARLHAIALELKADHAAAVMANLEAAADPTPWPSSTGGAGSSTSPTSPVLAAVERILDQPKPKPGQEPPAPIDAKAARLLSNLAELARLAGLVEFGLLDWSPARAITRCTECNSSIRPGQRCPKCSLREGAKRACADCQEPEDRHGLRPWPPKGWTGYVDGPGRVVCVSDWMWRHRHEGRPKVRLALGDNVIEQEATG